MVQGHIAPHSHPRYLGDWAMLTEGRCLSPVPRDGRDASALHQEAI